MYKMLTHYFSNILCEYIEHLIPANLPVNVSSQVVPMFLDNAQKNIEFFFVLSENIGTTYPITFIYGSVCSLHSREGLKISSV